MYLIPFPEIKSLFSGFVWLVLSYWNIKSNFTLIAVTECSSANIIWIRPCTLLRTEAQMAAFHKSAKISYSRKWTFTAYNCLISAFYPEQQWHSLYMYSKNLILAQLVIKLQYYLSTIILQTKSQSMILVLLLFWLLLLLEHQISTQGFIVFLFSHNIFMLLNFVFFLHIICPHLYISFCHPSNLVAWQHCILLIILSPGLWDICYVRVAVCNQKIILKASRIVVEGSFC